MLGLLAWRNKAKLLGDVNTSTLAAKDPEIMIKNLKVCILYNWLKNSHLILVNCLQEACPGTEWSSTTVTDYLEMTSAV